MISLLRPSRKSVADYLIETLKLLNRTNFGHMTFRTTLNNNKLGSGPPARDHSESSAMQVRDLQFKSLAGLRLRDSPVSVRVRQR